MDKHYVYFIGAINPKTETLDAIKIGMSKDPARRLASMSTDNPFACVLMSAIECETELAALQLEQSYHLQFSHTKLTGEWFSITPELLIEIYQVKGHKHIYIDRASEYNPTRLAERIVGALQTRPMLSKKQLFNDIKWASWEDVSETIDVLYRDGVLGIDKPKRTDLYFVKEQS